MTRSDINIGLLWHSASSGNLGVGALTIANMAIIRAVAHDLGLTPRFTIIGMRDGAATYVSEDEAAIFEIDARALLDPRRCLAVIQAQDCILDIGAGDSFTDIYGSKRYAFLWLTKAMAIATRTPLMFSPQTIGPFSRQPHSALAGFAMRHAAVVMTRDEPSVVATRKLAPKARCVRSTDVAFALPFEDRSAQRGRTLRAGVNVSGLLFNDALNGRNRFGLDVEYAELMRSVIGRLQGAGAEVCLISHVTTDDPEDDDGRVADYLASEYPGTVRVPNFSSPVEAKSYISGLDFLVSARMHACIAALSSGTPVVPIAYSRKFQGLFGAISYPWTVDVKGRTTLDAVEFVMSSFERRAELAADCAQSMSRIEALHDNYRAELRPFLAHAVAR